MEMRVGIALAATLLFGAVPNAASAQKVWRHAIIEAKSDAGFAMMAKARGFAERQGLSLEIMQIKADQIGLKALLAGELDSYEGGPGGAIVAAARGADVKILGCHWPGLVHGLFAREGIDKIEDLKARNVAISAPGALPDLLIRAALAQHGVAITDVKFANMGSDTDRYKALSAGVVDAAIVSTEYLPIAPKSMKPLATGREILPNFMRVCMITSSKVLAAKGDEAVRFLAAEIAALRYAVANRDEEIKLTRETTKAKPDDPRPGFIFDEAVKHRDIDPEIGLPMDKLAWTQEMLLKNGSMPKPADLTKVIAPDVRAKALELVK